MIKLETLKKREQFLAVQKHGKQVAAAGLVLQCRCKGEHHPRLGFTVSKKVGNAVERNRVKRRLRALAREILPKHVKAGCDYVLVGRRAALTRPFDKLKADLTYVLHAVEKA